VDMVKNAVSMGANVNTKLANSLLLCLKNIEGDSDTVHHLQVAIFLLEAGISMEYREEAARSASSSERKNIGSAYPSGQRQAVACVVFRNLLENHPTPEGCHHVPTDKVARSTKKAWSSLLFSQQYSDVVFVLKSNGNEDHNKKAQEEPQEQPRVILYAHRNILAASSPYFARYFRDWGATKEEFETSNSKAMMEIVLKFIYSGEVPPKEEAVVCATELLAVAGEYDIEDLQKLAEETLVEQLCLENVKDAFMLADLHNSETLKAACGDFVRKNACTAMFDDGILQLKEENPSLWKDLQRYVAI